MSSSVSPSSSKSGAVSFHKVLWDMWWTSNNANVNLYHRYETQSGLTSTSGSYSRYVGLVDGPTGVTTTWHQGSYNDLKQSGWTAASSHTDTKTCLVPDAESWHHSHGSLHSPVISQVCVFILAASCLNFLFDIFYCLCCFQLYIINACCFLFLCVLIEEWCHPSHWGMII